ncbi:hypothetical protein [Streptomyces cahuitamycinicus]|uniref:Uncharacterized protein n=1 Tax=Streptomyces cahuitamycinicus TaxID=2070367 RepID=A0A2N8TX54_9ACTN|nr:hypothetical protein [Streptomyces cahuitamycinicus]PNG23550.1 hypothetical protein C1J00_03160 [Streptomyces cahuitamycinicus]
MTVIITLILLATTACGLEHNHRRQPYPRPSLNGSTDVHDRDAERVRAELGAAADWAELGPLGMPVANDHATSSGSSPPPIWTICWPDSTRHTADHPEVSSAAPAT